MECNELWDVLQDAFTLSLQNYILTRCFHVKTPKVWLWDAASLLGEEHSVPVPPDHERNQRTWRILVQALVWLANDRTLCLCISCVLGMTFWCCMFSGTYLRSLGISVWCVARNTGDCFLTVRFSVKMSLRGDKTWDSVSSNTHESFLQHCVLSGSKFQCILCF